MKKKKNPRRPLFKKVPQKHCPSTTFLKSQRCDISSNLVLQKIDLVTETVFFKQGKILDSIVFVQDAAVGFSFSFILLRFFLKMTCPSLFEALNINLVKILVPETNRGFFLTF